MGRPRWPKMKSHHLMWRLKLQIFLVLFPHLKSTFDIHHISCVSSSSTFGIFNFHMHNIDHNFTWFKTRGSFPFLDLLFFFFMFNVVKIWVPHTQHWLQQKISSSHLVCFFKFHIANILITFQLHMQGKSGTAKALLWAFSSLDNKFSCNMHISTILKVKQCSLFFCKYLSGAVTNESSMSAGRHPEHAPVEQDPRRSIRRQPGADQQQGRVQACRGALRHHQQGNLLQKDLFFSNYNFLSRSTPR